MQINHNFKKQFGQNFLKSKRFPKEIVKVLDVLESDTIFEIGPGDGILTNELLKTNNQIVSIEIDYDLVPRLLKRFSNSNNFDIVNEDFLELNLFEVFERYNITSDIKFAGSLPYNIAKKIIRKLIDFNLSQSKFFISKMVFIVQEEVAKDYVAKPPNATVLSTLTGIYAKTKKLSSIPAKDFFPVPKVNGAILVIEPFKNATKNENLEKLTRIAFSSPRKTLRKNLKSSNKFNNTSVDDAILSLGLKENVRAHEVPTAMWNKLCQKISLVDGYKP